MEAQKYANPEAQLQLLNFLEAFLPCVDSAIPTQINAGGCGIFAKHLITNLNTLGLENDFKLIYVAPSKLMESLNYTLKNNKINDSHVGIEHCYVKINDFIYVDSNGIEISPALIADNDEMFCGEISLEVLQTLIDNDGSWNDVFDRDCETQIAEELGKMKDKFNEFLTTGTLDVEFKKDVKFTKHTVKAMHKADGLGMLAHLLRD